MCTSTSITLFYHDEIFHIVIITVYINHRPAFGLDPQKLVHAFQTLGVPSAQGNSIERGYLLDLLQTKGNRLML